MIKAGTVAFLLCLCIACRGGGENGQTSADTSDASKKESPRKAGLVKIDSSALANTGVQTVQVHVSSVPANFKVTGQIALNEERTAHVGTYVDGRVTAVKAQIGDYVRTGQVLARLHSHTVHEIRGALDSARQEVERQKQAVEYRKRMLERMNRLLALKSASQQEVERAQTDLTSAETDLRNAQINVGKETAHLSDILRMPESQLSKISEETERPPLLAPIEGQVVDRKITVGTVLEPGQEAFTISDLTSVWMTAAVNEADIAKVRVGLPVVVRTQAYIDEPFPGRITYLGAELDTQTRTLPARVVIANRLHKLHAGMFAEAEIEQRSARQTLFIPEEALQDLNGGSVVFRRKGEDQYEPQPVTIAARSRGRVEISAGLNEGDVIVTRGSFVVKSELLKSRMSE
ncbi:MAG: efflux RND transporter periplasmic adaptor subunit [Bryobacteraceae bacterium]